MNDVFLRTQNVREFQDMMTNLEDIAEGQPGLGLVYGRAGRGKTVCAKRYATQTKALYMRTLEGWTPRAMLAALCFELCKCEPHTTAKAMTMACEKLDKAKRTIIVDEADRLNPKLVEHWRDIHDITGVPVVLVGEESLYPMLNAKRRLWSRVVGVVEFGPITAEDILLFASKAAGLALAPEAGQLIAQRSDGDFRLVYRDVSGLARMAKAGGTTTVVPDMVQALPALLGGKHGNA
ncbi:AAA family ATPase [Desulfovibrio inopinatus]|uniref:AAA family ATPase n=1 Tax=Desulfovibrio inopinatus TaxID=102109 RepID=UPI00040A7772|nr:ATP-binding protein [Desulfovibrio inopinatus]